ncbi:salicylate hydroxylase [Xylariaceae sp. FL0594]|nr:salicylate hydroxylase [Xylariaceae sp. FL0594]
MSYNQVRLAIVGGGLAGAALANALIRHGHQRADGPTTQLLIRRAHAVPVHSTRFVMGAGPEAGEVIAEIGDRQQHENMVVHRGSLLRELLAPLPHDRLHLNKKLCSITRCIPQPPLSEPSDSGGVELGFEDGATERFDGVIGADGVFSGVRQFVLQDHHPDAVAPCPSGFWDARVLVPFERAKEVLGEQYLGGETDRQHAWSGGVPTYCATRWKTRVSCITADRRITLTRERLETRELAAWLEGPIADKMINVCVLFILYGGESFVGYYNLEHRNTPTYANNCVAIMGDAAHAMTPWQGAGVGQAFEDAAVLGSLFAKVFSSKDVRTALSVFDVVRRPRCQRIIESSRETGMIMCGLSDDVGMNVREMREALESRWVFIHAFDLEKHIEDALRRLGSLQENSDPTQGL